LEGREEALRMGLPVAGMIGVLEKAAERGWIELEDAFSRLVQRRFHVSADLMEQALERDAARRRQRERGL